jgi:hypothetical protein
MLTSLFGNVNIDLSIKFHQLSGVKRIQCRDRSCADEVTQSGGLCVGAAPFVLPDCFAGDATASLARRISASAVLAFSYSAPSSWRTLSTSSLDFVGKGCILRQRRGFSCRMRVPGYGVLPNVPPGAVHLHRQRARQGT